MPLTRFITSYSKSAIIHIADFVRKENSLRRKTLYSSSQQTQVSTNVNSPLQNRMLPLAANAGSDFRWRTGRLLPYHPTGPTPRHAASGRFSLDQLQGLCPGRDERSVPLAAQSPAFLPRRPAHPRTCPLPTQKPGMACAYGEE